MPFLKVIKRIVPWMWRNSQLQKCEKFKGYNYKSKKDYSSMPGL